jgi:hypothetical protein
MLSSLRRTVLLCGDGRRSANCTRQFETHDGLMAAQVTTFDQAALKMKSPAR